MPIPSQNDFLHPFLNFLNDGKDHSRLQLITHLKKHFNLSDEEAQTKSGNQFTLISRIAWCDVHFVKANFVEKFPHPQNRLQDTFRITTLGIRELNRRASKLTVGYLQGFYKGKVHRGAGSDDTTSQAELTLYEAFNKLPDIFTVFHGVKWFARLLGTVGEIDFIIVHPDYGALVLEVKGGEIRIENGQWYSNRHAIKDPCEQAERNRRALQDWIHHDPKTKHLSIALFPAVALPDAYVSGHIRPDCPEDIFIDMRHLHDLEKRILEIFAYWQQRADIKNARMDGQKAVAAMVKLLVPTRTLQARIVEKFAQENHKIEELTQQQFKILKKMRYQKRVAVIGGAGTGKTLLAMEKATQLAESDLRVLLLCFNSNLAKWIQKRIDHPNIDALTFHGFVGQMVRRVGLSMSSDVSFYEQAPDLLLDATEILHAPDADRTMLYDAIIVDEGQDFNDTWWIGLLDMLKDADNGVFYVFFDDNQRIFTQISQIPMDGAPLYLDENLRNTKHIHERMLPYTDDTDIECIGPEGRPVEIIATKDADDERRKLQRILHYLVNEEGVPIKDIIILTPASEKSSQWKNDDQLGNFTLTWDLNTEKPMAARLCSIQRYKGLESPVVILTELYELREEIARQLLYVGLSRARHHAVIIGELPTLESLSE